MRQLTRYVDGMVQPEATTDRFIPLEGAFNVRDFGGLPTVEGRVVRRGLIFRADSPRRLTAADRAVVTRLGIRHVVDLRTGAEAEQGSWVVGETTSRYHYEVIDAMPDPTRPGLGLPLITTPEEMAERYMFRVEAVTSRYAAAAETVARHASERVLFHCTAGKDRTGILAAALLSMLGVADADIVDDYALSAVGVERKIAHQCAHPLPGDTAFDLLPPLAAQAPAEVMQRFLALMAERHGGFVALLMRHGFSEQPLMSFRATMLADARRA